MKLRNISGRRLEIVDVPATNDGEIVELSDSMGKRLMELCNHFEIVDEEVKEKKEGRNKKFKGIEKE
jgi:hypothetical protein